jgi:hypothetical protein
MLETITHTEFSSLVDIPLEMESTGGVRYPVSVGEVRTFTDHDQRPQTPFAVILIGPSQPVLSQGIYTLHHPIRGGMDLFVVPIGPDARGMRYEIVFN